MKVKTAIFIILIIFLVFPLFANDTLFNMFLNQKPILSAQANLNLQMEWGAFGIPSGVKEEGINFFLDLDNNRAWTKPYQPLPSVSDHEEGWDIAITYTQKEVAMGPMGIHPLPFLDAIVNDLEGASYYMEEGSLLTPVSLDLSSFKEKGWKGYPFRDFKENRKMFNEKYRNAFPFLCYDWYEVINMKRFKYQAYPNRIFIIRSTEKKFYKLQFVQVNGKDSMKKGLFLVDLVYQPF